MRVAIFSDVHGNLPALEAVLADMQRRGPFDQIVAAGDRAGHGRTRVASVGEETVLALRAVPGLQVHVVEDLDRGVLGHAPLEAEEAEAADDHDGEEE